MRLAVIPARGGSKRVPRKNIRPFCGRPMIAYSIDAARECGLFDKVVVSTDDDEIAAVANSFGAETPFRRPANLADDFVSPSEAVKHAILWFQGQGVPVEFVCCIYPTAPFIKSTDLVAGFHKLSSSSKTFVFTVTTFAFPVQRAVRINPLGEIEPLYPENVSRRSQELETAYHDAGQFYWARPEGFLENIPIFSPAALPLVLDRHSVQDIDTEEDWRRAELMFQAARSRA